MKSPGHIYVSASYLLGFHIWH